MIRTGRTDQPSRSKVARALLLSPDFLIGVPVGAALGLLPVWIEDIRALGTGYLLTLAAIDAAVAALVLTPMTMLLGSLSEPFKRILRQVPGGVAGTLIPFYQVTIIAVAGCVVTLVSAMLVPLASGTYWWVIWIGTALPFALSLWAIIGCSQATAHLISMVRASERMIQLEADRDAIQRRKTA